MKNLHTRWNCSFSLFVPPYSFPTLSSVVQIRRETVTPEKLRQLQSASSRPEVELRKRQEWIWQEKKVKDHEDIHVHPLSSKHAVSACCSQLSLYHKEPVPWATHKWAGHRQTCNCSYSAVPEKGKCMWLMRRAQVLPIRQMHSLSSWRKRLRWLRWRVPAWKHRPYSSHTTTTSSLRSPQRGWERNSRFPFYFWPLQDQMTSVVIWGFWLSLENDGWSNPTKINCGMEAIKRESRTAKSAFPEHTSQGGREEISTLAGIRKYKEIFQ